ncbi:MAG: phosphate signaling complex protein PhoU [Planctomycetes bacterium]|nr:phosphate signaling complex protein PhoU [Planctomycetota bacterium]
MVKLMERHFTRELELLKRDMLSAGALALSALRKSLTALAKRDIDLANQVIEADRVLDDREMRVEEECLKLLALYQPVAGDLRFVASVIKINSMVERLGDIAVNIGRRARYLAKRAPLPVDIDFPVVGNRVVDMLDKALQSFVELSSEKANEVLKMDAEVDAAYRRINKQLIEFMTYHPDRVEDAVQTMNLARHLERAADRATDIAEQVLYILSGTILRHHKDRDDAAIPEEPKK